MQTYLPYADFYETAHCLRDYDLTTQIEHTVIILSTLHELDGFDGYQTHRAVKMWREYDAQLSHYGLVMCEEAEKRGLEVSGQDERLAWHLGNIASVEDFEMSKPPWMLDRRMKRVETTSRAVLLRRDRDFYKQYKWNVPEMSTLYYPRAS